MAGSKGRVQRLVPLVLMSPSKDKAYPMHSFTIREAL